MSSSNFTGKVVLITGSSSGIGHRVAVHLASLGAQVVITGRNEERLNQAAEECRQASPQKLKPVTVVADICNESDCRQLVDETMKQCGRLDTLVNNAGVMKSASIASANVMAVYDEVMTTNVRNQILLIHLCVPHLAKTQGNIVNIASIAGHRPAANLSAYNMSKAALLMATRVLAIELGPMKIRVNSISPAVIRTPLIDAFACGHTEQYYQLMGQAYPVGRVGEGADVAKTVAYLASDDAAFVCGADLILDGGVIDTHEHIMVGRRFREAHKQ